MLSVPLQTTYTKLALYPHSLHFLLGTKDTRGPPLLWLVSFPFYSQSPQYSTPLQYNFFLQRKKHLCCSECEVKIHHLLWISTGPLAGNQFLCSPLSQQKFMKGFPHSIFYFLILYYSLNSSKVSYGTVLPGDNPHKCQQVNNYLSSHSSYSK